MATITVENVPDSFLKKYNKTSFYYNEVSINVKEDNDSWDTEYTEENHKAWLKWREELERGKTTTIDFDKVKTPDDFISFLKSN